MPHEFDAAVAAQARNLGLVAPPVALARRQAGLQLLGTQPTGVAWTTTDALPVGRLISPSSAVPPYAVNSQAPYRYFGSNFVVPSQLYPDYLFVWPFAVTGQYEQGYGWVDVETDATTLEIVAKGYGSSGRLLIDNFDGQGLRVVSNAGTWAASAARALAAQFQPTTGNPDNNIFRVTSAGSTAATQPTWANASVPGATIVDGTITWTNVGPTPSLAGLNANDGGIWYLPVSFATRRWRRIVWEGSSYFGGIKVGRTDTLKRSGVPIGPRTIIVGDSFTEGSGSVDPANAWPIQFAHLRGQLDTWQSGEGATGYLADGSGSGYTSRHTFRLRLQDVTTYSPDLVIVFGGFNDTNSTAAQIRQEAALYFQAIKTGCIGTNTGLPPLLVVAGLNLNTGFPFPPFQAIRDGIRQAALLGTPGVPPAVDCYIETLYGPFPYSGFTVDYINDGTTLTANPRSWWSGSGKQGAPAGDGNCDFVTYSDGIHPTVYGHQMLAQRIDAGMELWRQAGSPFGFLSLA